VFTKTIGSCSAACRDAVLAENREELIARKQVIYKDYILKVAIVSSSPL